MEAYTVEEAANKLKCSKDKVYELIRQDEIKPVTYIGKAIRIPNISLEAFMLGVPANDLIEKIYTTKVVVVKHPQAEKSIDYEALGRMVTSTLKQGLSNL